MIKLQGFRGIDAVSVPDLLLKVGCCSLAEHEPRLIHEGGMDNCGQRGIEDEEEEDGNQGRS